MDWDCDHLVYRYTSENSSDEGKKIHCPLCSLNRPAIHEHPAICSTPRQYPCIMPFQQALTGRMTRHVQILEEQDQTGPGCSSFHNSGSVLYFVKDGVMASLQGEIHMQDVSPSGTWLSAKAECRKSLSRLRLAGLICLHLPELNRIVLEQKNDDGLLYLTNKWLWNKENMSEGIQLFGPFACDAMLAPVLHKVLRSDWIEQRKEHREVNHELKLGWAQEFYNWKAVARGMTGSILFAHGRSCPCESDKQTYNIVRNILDKMRWCGYSPWSAVHAVRCSELSISNVACPKCNSWLLASCTFLIECAAAEASRDRDWLVRNEAVIQLCWLLYQIYKQPDYQDDEDTSLEAWVESTVVHAACLQDYKRDAQSDAETLVVLFANDHLQLQSKKQTKSDQSKVDMKPPLDLLGAIERNERFKAKREAVFHTLPSASDGDEGSEHCIVSNAVDVLEKAPDGMVEARPQRLDDITMALVSCFPRVAASALCELTFSVPKTQKFTRSTIWPLFVNRTRTCYALFRALAFPVSPEPAYVLELLARAWRNVPHKTLECFIPMCSGGLIQIKHEHYTQHLAGPLNTLALFNVISGNERDLMMKVLSVGVLPCFATVGDSAPDRLVSSTVALSFAACGLRVFDLESELRQSEGDHECITVTVAGLLYFAAWYILVYTSALHMHPTLNKLLARTGTDADKHICAALNSQGMTVSQLGSVSGGIAGQCNVAEIMKALGVVFGTILNPDIVHRCAQLFIPELLMQLPFTKKLSEELLPGSIKCALESRDVWFGKNYAIQNKIRTRTCEPPFRYLGTLAYRFHSSIQGTLTNSESAPVAQALGGLCNKFDSWYDSLVILTFDETHEEEKLCLGFEQILRVSLENQMDKEMHEVPRPVLLEVDSEECQKLAVLSTEDHSNNTSFHQSPIPHRELTQGGNTQAHHVCQELLVDTVDGQGFNMKHNFLTVYDNKLVDNNFPKRFQSTPAVQKPCMTKIAFTTYSKVESNKNIGNKNACTPCTCLIDALWILLCADGTPSPPEPSTPEALAVMVHLVAKSLQLNAAQVLELSVCNDIQALYSKCQEEGQFVPIAAIVGGIFGLNLTVNVNQYTYQIVNSNYMNKWANGSVWYSDVWYVTRQGHKAPVDILRERSTPNCYHHGTLQAYMRLNSLKVLQVESDNYCGFHTVATLLRIKDDKKSEYRKLLAGNTAQYMITHKDDDRISTYLKLNALCTHRAITDLLLQDKRWLHADEVSFMLEAHGVQGLMISTHSYPIYKPNYAYYLCKANHYEPVMPV